MNFDLDPADVAFREEVRQFLRDHLPADMAERNKRGAHTPREDQRAWTKLLNRQGWSGPNWPREWGGTGWSPVRYFIFEDECFRAGAPPIDTSGFKMIGPVLMRYGSEALKQEFGPRILDGDVFWGQGFSEPESGSDLGSLSTRAVRDGDEYVINGRKIWTSYVEKADMIFLLAKTDPAARQRGISMLLVDKHAPGVTIRPIIDIGEIHSLNEVFFDNVRTPARYLVGEEGMGWGYGKYLLDLERAFSAEWPRNKRNLQRLREIASLERAGAERLIDAPGFAARLASLEVDLQALEWLTLRALYDKAGGSSLPVGSLLKVRGSELLQKIGEMQVEALGDYAAYIHQDPEAAVQADAVLPPGAEQALGIVSDFMYRRAATIYGGANEVQRNIIARSFLEL
ncbi:MAG: acyl-CoA dehydrogenase family protein [Janthinobacterium lividum]